MPGAGLGLRYHSQGGGGRHHRQLHLHPTAGGERRCGACGALFGAPPLHDPNRGPRPAHRPDHRHPHGESRSAGPCAGTKAWGVCEPGLPAGGKELCRGYQCGHPAHGERQLYRVRGDLPAGFSGGPLWAADSFGILPAAAGRGEVRVPGAAAGHDPEKH